MNKYNNKKKYIKQKTNFVIYIPYKITVFTKNKYCPG